MTDDFKPGRYQMFGGSSELITPKSLLWRYMTFEKFCWLVETSRLYHPRLDQFNDPFEGAVTDAYARLRDSGAMRPYFSTKEYEHWGFRSLRLRSYATCWHASEHESDAQWQLYASGGAGLAIVSTMERLRQSVDFSPHVSGILGQVEYVDFDRHEMRRRPFNTVIRPGHLKRKSFEHEREVRGLIISETIDPPFTLDEAFLAKLEAKMPRGIHANVSQTELIQAIILSPFAAGFVEELVHILTTRHRLDHLVCKSQMRGSPAY